MKTNELRQSFIKFFQDRGHKAVSSDSLVPSGDPTLLFTSAGMVQFKKHFLGQVRLDYRRAASCQKCLRTSDIERVGFTARHHTFFEMLGNFSFGDYFKKEAIDWGWEFLTKDCGLDPKKLYASIYKEDEESFQLWKKILPESRIIRLGEESNFWNMGPTGPCGPCSEILIDQGEKFSCGKSDCGPGCDCDRYLEVWNLVFTQFDRQPDGTLKPLPQKNIDTGMGLERLAAVVNGHSSNFQIDLFQNLIDRIRNLPGQKTLEETPCRVIADHLRACAFLVSDGILPSNEGRGYVLRRLLRRALRQGWIHGQKEPFLYQLVEVICRDMGQAYPDLIERRANIESILLTEEKNTLQTIEAGTRYLTDEIRALRKKAGTESGKVALSGEKVFYIYDTFGLDKEIQKEIVQDLKGDLIFSEQEYEKAREKAVEIARKGWKGSGETDTTVYAALQKKTGNTVFRGYETNSVPTKVTAILKFAKSGQSLSLKEEQELKENEEGELILEETPFYAESGGQVGDRGGISAPGLQVEVRDTQKPFEGLIVHKVRVKKGTLKTGDTVEAKIDLEFRKQTMSHHTATHLLHAVLRKTLGKQVTQAGSLVSPEKLRFDFTYPKGLASEELAFIEREVNKAVLANIPRNRGEHSLEEARKHGALAFFGDKYGEKVFVVSYGEASTEVCGGTHCLSTGEIGLFKITSESSVASGVRRIEAVTGEKAVEWVQEQEKLTGLLTAKLRSNLSEAPEKIDKLLQRQSELEREVTELKKKVHQGDKTDFSKQAKRFQLKDNGEYHIVANEIDSVEPKLLREIADNIRDKIGTGIVVLATRQEDKSSFVVTLTPDCVKKGFHAGKIATQLAEKIGGKGGGKENFAQGGGKSDRDLKKILEEFPDEIDRGLRD